MNDLMRSEEANEISFEVIELGRMSEETKGSTAGPITEQSVLPVRI